jgi:hypothetical protein
MTRYALEFVPRRSWQQDVDPADQRWTRTPNVFSGTEAEATIECSELEAAYDRSVTFRAVPLETLESEVHFCPSCGGDYRERIGHQLACTCPMALASTAGIRWTEEKAS